MPPLCAHEFTGPCHCLKAELISMLKHASEARVLEGKQITCLKFIEDIVGGVTIHINFINIYHVNL